MTAERRDTPRIPVSLETILDYNHSCRRTKTRNISLDGVFIDSMNNGLAEKTLLELAIKLPVLGASKYHRFQAEVVHVTPNGAGLLFDRVDTDSYAALLDLVFSRQGYGP